jgi:hypothetical protein
MLFVEGLSEPLWGWVKAYKPTYLQDVVSRARDMHNAVPRSRFLPKPIFTPRLRRPYHLKGIGSEITNWMKRQGEN